ncbi:MAG: carbohydrate kinase family protein [Candidatus Micrarchaeota archaeon]|nr:carbohydrate kinase family protein [Candidatus Micrarchaeota archaeon]
MNRKYDIITVGSATIDIFINTGSELFRKGNERGLVEVPFGSKIVAEGTHIDMGGGGTNTAVAFSRMGFKTAFIGKVGDDSNGKSIMTSLRKEKVDVHLVSKTAKEKTGFSIILDAKGRDRTIIVYKGANDMLRFSEIRKSELKTDWFYFSSMMDKSFETLEKLAEFAKRKRIKVMFNPSAYLAEKGTVYLKKILDATDILILNDKEAHILSKKNSLQMMARELYRICKCIVVITLGDKGAMAYDGSKMHLIRADKVHVVETTGAGDAFASGFLAGFIKSGNIDFALMAGKVQAESVITHYGSKNKLLSWRTVNSLIGK